MASRAPFARGLKVTEIVQLAPISTNRQPLPEMLNSAIFMPVKVGVGIEKGAVPRLVTTIDNGLLLVPVSSFAKVKDVALMSGE